MELAFLDLLDWRMEISPSVYDCVLKGFPNIQAAALSPCSTQLIPDEVMPLQMWREHLGLEPRQESTATNGTSWGTHEITPAGSPCLSQQYTWIVSRTCTALSEQQVSVAPYEVSSLTLLPMSDFDELLDRAMCPQAPAVVETFRPHQALDSDNESGGDAVAGPLGLDREVTTRYCSRRAVSTRSVSTCSYNSGRSTPRAKSPRPPQQPRAGVRPNIIFAHTQSSRFVPEPASPKSSPGPDPTAPGGAGPNSGAASCGKRARIEEARAHAQESDTDSLL
eukprot:TRINITY_DN1635_c0_g1_i3.p1 TRINITY_DN1635_c0_g1~~TRINITY_DN1635_c0_g1_i3.p1  ORF type:complete len:279 (+),score=49.28 TRINITY_DN1635_c0_g1_i3:485-1321(+)